jgi:hypothetical protein
VEILLDRTLFPPAEVDAQLVQAQTSLTSWLLER